MQTVQKTHRGVIDRDTAIGEVETYFDYAASGAYDNGNYPVQNRHTLEQVCADVAAGKRSLDDEAVVMELLQRVAIVASHGTGC